MFEQNMRKSSHLAVADRIGIRDAPSIDTAVNARHAELACIEIVQAVIELAFSLLQLAEAEIRSGNTVDSADMISTAILAYESVLHSLEELPRGFEEEGGELRGAVQALRENIHAAEQHSSP